MRSENLTRDRERLERWIEVSQTGGSNGPVPLGTDEMLMFVSSVAGDAARASASATVVAIASCDEPGRHRQRATKIPMRHVWFIPCACASPLTADSRIQPTFQSLPLRVG